MWSNSAGTISRKDKNAERNNGASDDSLERFAVANQDRGLTKHLSQEGKENQVAKHHFRKALNNFEGCAE